MRPERSSPGRGRRRARHCRSVLALVASLAALSGCHAWRRDPAALRQPLDERARIEVWSHGTVQELHGVRLLADTIVAVPYWKPPSCDSCAVRIPRSTVDSIRVQVPDQPRSAVLAGFLVATVIFVTWLGTALAGLKD